MYTGSTTFAKLQGSVIAVPPLARNADLSLNQAENTKLIRHLEAGGVDTLLYGGNANLYNIALSEYDALLKMLSGIVAKDTWVVPSLGPSFGMMMDQARILKQHAFPTAMVLPPSFAYTPAGLATGIRKAVEVYGKPIVLYLKEEHILSVDDAKRLVDDKLVSWIKYAVVRKDPTQDAYLSKLVSVVDPKIIISGIGEQPAIIHMRDFGVAGFTAGCVCVAPKPSAALLKAVLAKNWAEAERLRALFVGLEDLRNAISPIRVLHEAVSLSGVADMGPILPILSPITDEQKVQVGAAAKALLKLNV
jgi:dihydrodipicolinate synthase/N-acetylneuraminate lyase